MAGKLSSIDLAIFLLYIVGTILFGCSFFRRDRGADSFTAGNRSMPGWACAMSILATYVSSISFLANPGKAYASNWNSYVFALSLPIAIWIAIKFFVPLYRERGDVSAYSYLEARFGPWARVYASICYLLTQLSRMAVVMFLTAMPVRFLLGWDLQYVILLTGISVTIYTVMGGIEAVIWNDTIQGFLLIGGAILCAVLIPFSLPEGPAQMFRIAAEHNKFDMGPWNFSFVETSFWLVLIYGLFINLQNFGIDQSYIQRMIAAKSDREARKSVWLGGLLYIPVSALFFFIGTALFAYYNTHPELLQDLLANLPADKAAAFQEKGVSAIGDYFFPHYIVSVLPVGLTGLLIAAVFAAAMSTVSTSLNSSATLILTDYYKRYVNKNATEKQSMAVLYTTSIVLGLAGTVFALAMIKVESALDAWWKLSGVFSGGMLGLFLLGYFARRAKNFEAAVGVAVGVLIICWMSLSPKLPESYGAFRCGLHGFFPIVFGTSAIFLVGFLLANFLNRNAGKENQ